MSSPLGPLGKLKGYVVEGGHLAVSSYHYLTNPNYAGLSPGVAVSVLCGGGLIFTLLLGVIGAKMFGTTDAF